MSDVTVLAVDPDQTVLSFLRLLLSSRGFAFSGARQGGQALRRSGALRPAAIVLRAVLPDMGGADFITRLSSKGRVPPLLVTALPGQEPEVASCLEAGAATFLLFPLDEREVVERVEGLVLRDRGSVFFRRRA